MCFQFPVLLFEGKEIYLEDNEKMERNFEGFFFFFCIFRSFRDS